jgi:hypothetical protein
MIFENFVAYPTLDNHTDVVFMINEQKFQRMKSNFITKTVRISGLLPKTKIKFSLSKLKTNFKDI